MHLLALCYITLCLLKCCLTQSDRPLCDVDRGWEQKDNNCYREFETKVVWDEAKRTCEKEDATLPVLLNSDTNLIIEKMVRKYTWGDFWIGLKYEKFGDDEYDWKWVTQELLKDSNFAGWRYAVPQISKNDPNYCVYMTKVLFGYTPGKTWMHKSCTVSAKFICQKPLGSCPPGWYHVGRTCYHLGLDSVTWQDADNSCRALNARLTMIKSYANQTNIVKVIMPQLSFSEVWIGLFRNIQSRVITWIDNSEVSLGYDNWARGSPSRKYDCGQIKKVSNEWTMANCSEPKQFVCEMPDIEETPSSTPAPMATTATTPSWDRRCPSAQWTFSPDTGLCYLVNPGPVYWTDAKSFCEQKGADLTSILSQTEQDFIKSLTSRDVAGYWIGMRRESQTKWIWTDDSPFAYFNFDNSSKDSIGTFGKLMRTGTWKFDEDKQDGYICKKTPLDQSTTLQPATSAPYPPSFNRRCPRGWSFIFYNCIQMINDSVTWDGGRKACLMKEGDLASIGSAIEDELLSFQASIAWGSGSVWIGLRSNKAGANGHQYFWSDKTPVTFTKWGSMISGSDTTNCASFDFKGRVTSWSVNNCEERRPILCKRPPIDNSSSTEPSSPYCPIGFSLSGSKCLFIPVTARTTRSNAASSCAQLGGYLVTILNKNEQLAVELELSHHQVYGKRLWIGLTKVENTWRWNETIPAMQFDNRIDKDGNGTCASLRTDTDPNEYGRWINEDCDSDNVWGFICEATSNMSTTTAGPTTPDSRGCVLGPGWKAVGDRCFSWYSAGQLKTWIEARDDCRKRGGYIASIKDDDTNSNLAQFPSSFYTESWIGLNSRDRKDNYIWSNENDIDLTYQNWAENQPNSHNEIERCGIYNTTDQKWSLLNCNVGRPYFCSAEKGATAPPTPTTTTGVPTASPICGGDPKYTYFNNYCYKVAIAADQKITWYDARDRCMEEGGDLASILTEDEEIILQYMLVKKRVDKAWIGFKSFGGSTDYKWSDGNVPTYYNWARTRLTNATGNHFCAFIDARDGFWYDLPCNQQRLFLCKRPSSASIPIPQTDAPATPLPGNCPAEWKSAGDKCYRIFSGPNLKQNFSSAVDNCNTFPSGYLASITSQIELATLTAMMKNVKENVWIGYMLQEYPHKWLWLDNSPTGITNWNKGQPVEISGSGCTKMLSATESISAVGRWATSTCSEQLGFACMIYKSTDYTTAPTPGPTICPKGFVQQGTVCYKYSSSNANWDDGRRVCSSYQASLVSIYDIFEQSFVNSLINPYQSDNGVWIGLSNLDDMSSYQWTDGYDMIFARWNLSQPVTDVNKRCAFMRRTGFWIMDDCTANRPFICAIRTGSSPTSSPPNLGRCPPQWLTNGLYCYFIETGLTFQKVYNFEQAKANCQSQGAQLVSITSKSERDFIDIATENIIGRNLVRNDRWVWIGMTVTEDGDLLWTDNTPVDYLNWESGEPKKSGDEMCVAFRLTTRKWVTLRCSTQSGYVCKMSRIGLDSNTKSPTRKAETIASATTISDLTVISDPPEIGFIEALLRSKKNDGVVAAVSIVGIVILAAVAFAIVWYYRSKGSGVVKPELEVGFDNVYHYSAQNEQIEIKAPGAVN